MDGINLSLTREILTTNDLYYIISVLIHAERHKIVTQKLKQSYW